MRRVCRGCEGIGGTKWRGMDKLLLTSVRQSNEDVIKERESENQRNKV